MALSMDTFIACSFVGDRYKVAKYTFDLQYLVRLQLDYNIANTSHIVIY